MTEADDSGREPDESSVVPATPKQEAERHRARTVVAAVLGIVAVLALTVSIVAVWAEVTVLRAEPVADLVGDALAEPEVQTALAAYLADQVAAAVDLEAALTTVLPSALDQFAGTIAGGAQAAVERALTRILAEPGVQDVITTVVERAHDRAMALLEGDGLMDGISVNDGAISVNLLPLVGRGLTALQSVGLLQDVDVPELTADGDPDEQAAALEDALGRELPEDFGQLVVYESASVADAQAAVQTAQRMLVLAQRATWVLVALSLILIAATILVAPRRWRAVLVLGVGTAATMVVLRTAVRQVTDNAPDLVTRPGAKAAIEAILGGAAETLLRLAGIVLLLALVVVGVALLLTRWRRVDVVLVIAVALGAATVAILGISAIGLLVGVLVGIAVPFVARWFLPSSPAEEPHLQAATDAA